MCAGSTGVRGYNYRNTRVLDPGYVLHCFLIDPRVGDVIVAWVKELVTS